MAWKCPNCEEIIEHLDYRVSTGGTEYGTAYLTEENTTTREQPEMITDFSYGDGNSEWCDEPTLECRECNEEIDLEELIWVTGTEDNKEKPKPIIPTLSEDEQSHRIISPITPIITGNKLSQIDRNIICKNCLYVYVTSPGKNTEYPNADTIFTCPQCEYPNTNGEFQTLIKTNFFETAKKQKKWQTENYQ